MKWIPGNNNVNERIFSLNIINEISQPKANILNLLPLAFGCN